MGDWEPNFRGSGFDVFIYSYVKAAKIDASRDAAQ